MSPCETRAFQQTPLVDTVVVASRSPFGKSRHITAYWKGGDVRIYRREDVARSYAGSLSTGGVEERGKRATRQAAYIHKVPPSEDEEEGPTEKGRRLNDEKEGKRESN